jgi:hypothetical protein
LSFTGFSEETIQRQFFKNEIIDMRRIQKTENVFFAGMLQENETVLRDDQIGRSLFVLK